MMPSRFAFAALLLASAAVVGLRPASGQTLQEALALAYSNKVIPEARGEVQRILQEAQAYKERVIAEAHGEADRFLNVLEEYRKAPDLMRQRLYLETMERVLSSTDKVIIDSNGQQGVVPYLPLDQLQPKKQQ